MSKKNRQKETLQNKKDAVLETKTKKGNKGTFVSIGVALAIFAFVGFVVFSNGSGAFKTVEAEAGIVKIPVSEVSDGQAHYYTYNDSGGPINFFVLKSSDRVLRAAFDACDVCFHEKKGYRQEGDYMVCINCGLRFESVNINVLKGGCNPAPLERQVQGKGNYLLFKVSDIEEGRKYF